MSDKWHCSHAGTVHGPLSAEQLLALVGTGDLNPDDLIWPKSINPVAAVRAEAALAFPAAAPVDPLDFEWPTTPAPDWLPELAAALAAVRNLSALPPPPPRYWLPDIRRMEQPARPSEDPRSSAQKDGSP